MESLSELQTADGSNESSTGNVCPTTIRPAVYYGVCTPTSTVHSHSATTPARNPAKPVQSVSIYATSNIDGSTSNNEPTPTTNSSSSIGDDDPRAEAV